jgi:PPM family protein phosphatase
MNTFFLTDRGKVRKHNEDSGGAYYNQAGQLLTIVADGMGGHQAGDVASAMTVGAFEQFWKETESISTPEEAEKWIKFHVKKVNQHLYDHSKQHSECDGMGTTLVLAICSNEFVTVGHIGDSRCYVVKEMQMLQITEDHSLVNELVRVGQISKEDAEFHPRKNVILRSLGTDTTVDADIKTITNDEIDFLLLCSDGLSDRISGDEIRKHFELDTNIEEIGTKLVFEANNNGGQDNITLVLVEFNSKSVLTESGDGE